MLRVLRGMTLRSEGRAARSKGAAARDRWAAGPAVRRDGPGLAAASPALKERMGLGDFIRIQPDALRFGRLAPPPRLRAPGGLRPPLFAVHLLAAMARGQVYRAEEYID